MATSAAARNLSDETTDDRGSGVHVTSLPTGAAAVQHEATGLITTIVANLEFLEGSIIDGSGDVREALEDTRASVARMRELFANAFRVEREYVVTTRHTRVRVGALVEAAVKNMRAHASGRGIHLRGRTLRDCVSSVDAELVLRLTESLVDRAVRLSPADGTVLVTSNLDADEIIIQVADEGPAIPSDVCARLFEPDFDDETGAPNALTAGLGLSFCRAVAHAHGGSISVAKRAERGVVFTLRIPCC